MKEKYSFDSHAYIVIFCRSTKPVKDIALQKLGALTDGEIGVHPDNMLYQSLWSRQLLLQSSLLIYSTSFIISSSCSILELYQFISILDHVLSCFLNDFLAGPEGFSRKTFRKQTRPLTAHNKNCACIILWTFDMFYQATSVCKEIASL